VELAEEDILSIASKLLTVLSLRKKKETQEEN